VRLLRAGGVAIRELLDDRDGERIDDHLHMVVLRILSVGGLMAQDVLTQDRAHVSIVFNEQNRLAIHHLPG
jgi:hypothetical protein